MATLLAATGLTKRYGKTVALDQLSLTVESGTVFGLLGPNGSGKSTFLRLVLGFLQPDAGAIEFAADRRQIGYLPDRPAFPMRAKLAEYLTLIGGLAGLEPPLRRGRVRQILAEVGLDHAAQWPIGACSRGMLQRLALAAALIHAPRLLILDEPLNGLDPAGQQAMRRQIERLHESGCTLLISTHRLNDIAPLCTHLAILHRGRLLRTGSTDLLLMEERIVIATSPMSAEIMDRLRGDFPAASISSEQIELIGAACLQKTALLRALLDTGIDITGLQQVRTTPEDLYLATVQEAAL